MFNSLSIGTRVKDSKRKAKQLSVKELSVFLILNIILSNHYFKSITDIRDDGCVCTCVASPITARSSSSVSNSSDFSSWVIPKEARGRKAQLRQSQRPKNIKLIAIAVTRTEINSQVGNRDLDDT
ncbi:hypothetical protein G9A89_016636 [Geosiphon pyriformis]|nr:hypothetical protein G9A89_016636 [Geosiphon pyriformis]